MYVSSSSMDKQCFDRVNGKDSKNIYFKMDKGGCSGVLVMNQLHLSPMVVSNSLLSRIVINWTARTFYVVNVDFSTDNITDNDMDNEFAHLCDPHPSVPKQISYKTKSIKTFVKKGNAPIFVDIADIMFGPGWHFHMGFKASHKKNALIQFSKFLDRSSDLLSTDICREIAKRTFLPVERNAVNLDRMLVFRKE